MRNKRGLNHNIHVIPRNRVCIFFAERANIYDPFNSPYHEILFQKIIDRILECLLDRFFDFPKGNAAKKGRAKNS